MKSRVVKSTPAKNLPVFVFPEELNFVSQDQRTHKRILTIYNPYEFEVTFQVLSNAPARYLVPNPRGTVKEHCCVDIVIKHKNAHQGPFNTTDKFKVEICHGEKIIGSKVIVSHLKDEDGSTQSLNESLGFTELDTTPEALYLSNNVNNTSRTSQNISTIGLFPVVTTIACLVVLFLPLEGDVFSTFPSWTHVTINMKLMAAFVLGMMTMVFIKS